ncbi:hypothetical protein GCM10011374_28380 [Kocuria dechangensis]|uniref:DUF3618 domain-containing protein n=1 Tax=Kocuria dechangensis TaxID=1176249 RepID=A0A917H099_9MICC|nr:DUF3618 domain-containing protein [Kocuria dechangensis]GGG63336.1 hypothetical protein GCM10011374_28380 [Kocuria dechangensis]
MSQQNPEQIRAEIEATRARLGADVDAVAEKVTPERVVERQKGKVRDKVQGVRERVMGSTHDSHDEFTVGGYTTGDLKDEASYRAEQARGAVQHAPAAARAKTRGNPMAAGLIALGAGWLVGSLLPSTQKEQQLVADAAERVQPHAQHAVESAKGMAQEVAQDLKEPAQEAAQSLKETAQSGAQEVKSQGQDEAQQLKGSAQESAQTVKDQTKNA